MRVETRTLAVQISEDLFQRVKVYLAHYKLKQRDFIIDLLEDALQDFEDERSLIAENHESDEEIEE